MQGKSTHDQCHLDVSILLCGHQPVFGALGAPWVEAMQCVEQLGTSSALKGL